LTPSYTDSAVERVRLIQQLYAAGLGSKAIIELLPCVHTGIATPAILTRMAFERDRIDHRLRELTQTRNRLDEIILAARQSEKPCPAAVAPPTPASAASASSESDTRGLGRAG
jgi:DNA-binding transcriptional MerR regulator